MSEPHALPAGHLDIARDLRALGLERGDGVMVHGALSALGPTLAGPRSVIEGLVEAVGPAGLVVMPAFTADSVLPPLPPDLPDHARAHLEAQVPGFDPARSSASRLGALAEAFRSWPGVVRSVHPIRSLAALGPEAGRMLERHPRDWPLGLDGPMGRLAERQDMKVLLLGVGYDRCSALHTAETIATCRRLCVRHFKDTRHAPPRWVHARDVGDDAEGYFPDLGAAFDRTGSVRHGRVAGGEARLFALCDLLAFAAPWLTTRNNAARPVMRTRRDGEAS